MVGLTTKQKEELNLAIHEYLIKHKYLKAAEEFAEEAKLKLDEQQKLNGSSSSVLKDILERKWTSIAKLKKEVDEYKKQNQQLKEQQMCERCGGGLGLGHAGSAGSSSIIVGDGLPRQPEKFILKGHKSRITKVSMHPIYSDVASSSDDGTIKIWDYDQGEISHTLKGHTGQVNYVAFHPNGQILASCSTDQTIKLWNFQTRQVTKTLQGHEHEVSSIDFLPGGDFLVSCSRDNTIKLWDTNSGYCIQTAKGHNDWVRKVSVNSKGNLLASGGKDECVFVWNLEKLKTSKDQNSISDSILQVLREHENQIDCIKWATPEANYTIDSSDYNKNFIAMLNLQQDAGQGNGESQSENFPGIQDSPGQTQEETKDQMPQAAGEKLTAAERIQKMKQKLQEKKLAKKKEKGEGDKPEEEKKMFMSQVSEEFQRDYLASGCRDKTIKIWEAKSGRCVITLIGHDNWVNDLIFHQNGRFLISASDDKSIRVWDLNSGRVYKKIQSAHDHFVTSIDMRGNTLITGSVDNTLKVWSCR